MFDKSYSFLDFKTTLVIFLILLSNSGLSVGNKVENRIYSEAERSALDKFRPLVKDFLIHDYQKLDSFLINWLRAKQLDIPQAVDSLRKAQDWRIQNKVDSILNETILEFNEPPYIIDGVGLEGNPILLFSPGKYDLRKLLVQGSRDKVLRYGVQMVEIILARSRELSKETGKEINGIVGIVDITGFNLRQHVCLGCVRMLAELFVTIESYYPEIVKHAVFINVPRIAAPLIETLKPLLSGSSLRGLRIFTTDRQEWSNYLLKIIAPDQLPRKYGGTRDN